MLPYSNYISNGVITCPLLEIFEKQKNNISIISVSIIRKIVNIIILNIITIIVRQKVRTIC